MTFTLTIKSDNEDNGPEMVAEALEDVARKVDDGLTSGQIRDRNGNRVGEWRMS